MPAPGLWLPHELATIQRMRKENRSFEHMAQALGRTESAVKSKVKQMIALGTLPRLGRANGTPVTPEEIERIAQMYRQGYGPRAIGRALRRNECVVRQHTKRLKAERRPVIPQPKPEPKADFWTAERIETLIEMREAGHTLAEIGEVLCRSEHAVNNQVRKLVALGRLAPDVQSRGYWTAETIKRLVDMRHQGLSQAECARRLGRSEQAVHDKLAKLKRSGVDVPEVRAVAPPPPPPRQLWQRKCLGCSKPIEVASEFLRMCEPCRANARRVCW